MKVLLIEDEIPCAELMRRIMEPYVEEVFVAYSWAAAAQILLDRKHIDLIVIDLQLPDSLTDETLSKIPDVKKQHPEATIMIISGLVNEEEIRGKAVAVGADSFAPKRDALRSSANLLTAVWQAIKSKLQKGNSPTCERHIEMLEQFVEQRNLTSA